MILDCLTCHRPIPARNGQRDTIAYSTDAICGSCGAVYRITVQQVVKSKLTEAEVAARRNRTT